VVENLLQHYNNCLTLRIRMPISADLLHRNFITKIVNYQKVVDIPNSMTTLDDLLPVAIEAAQRKLTGILNLCNPGSISHNEILQLFKKHIDHRYCFFFLVFLLRVFFAGLRGRILLKQNATLSSKRKDPTIPWIIPNFSPCFQTFQKFTSPANKRF
jgi:hypothetical protein